jgi:hypothetical protein
METGNAKHTIHLIDLTADHYFGERQLQDLQSASSCSWSASTNLVERLPEQVTVCVGTQGTRTNYSS